MPGGCRSSGPGAGRSPDTSRIHAIGAAAQARLASRAAKRKNQRGQGWSPGKRVVQARAAAMPGWPASCWPRGGTAPAADPAAEFDADELAHRAGRRARHEERTECTRRRRCLSLCPGRPRRRNLAASASTSRSRSSPKRAATWPTSSCRYDKAGWFDPRHRGTRRATGRHHRAVQRHGIRPAHRVPAATCRGRPATFTLPDVRVGSVIEYRYELRQRADRALQLALGAEPGPVHALGALFDQVLPVRQRALGLPEWPAGRAPASPCSRTAG